MGEYAPSSEINYEYFRNIFWVGDTAQSISKGVIFKFSDIKLLFKN